MLKALFSILIWVFLTSPVMSQDESWEIVGEMPIPVYGGQAVATDSLIYIFGGYSESVYGAVNYIQTYDPDSNRWGLLEDTLLVPRYGFIAGFYGADLIFLGGASRINGKNISIERWDFEGYPVVLDTSAIFNRNFATGQIVDDVLYVFGGYPDYRDWADTLSMSYIIGYDISRKEIVYKNDELFTENILDGSMPYQQMSVLFNDDIYIFGGAHNGILIEVYRFGLSQKSWAPVFPALFEERAAGAAVQATNDMVLVIGGYNESFEAMASTEYYYPGFNYSEQGADLHVARKEFMSAKFGNAVYVFGGRDAFGNIVSEVERITFEGETSLDPEPSMKPAEFELLGNYPNPFNPETHIKLHNNISQFIHLAVYDISGNLVNTLFRGNLSAGHHEFVWNSINDDGKAVSSGVYIYRAETKYSNHSGRMILLR